MSPQKILIVDDSKLIRMQVREMLPTANVAILEAQDGAEGLQVIQQEQPTLVLMDCFMPKMNGWQVINRIQSYPELQQIPVVMMSGREEDVFEEAAELFSYFEFLAKPFDKAKLFQAIKAAMGKAKERQVKQVETMQPLGDTSASGAEIAQLRAEIQRLDHQNTMMRSELTQLRQQVSHLAAIVRQRLSPSEPS